MTVSGCRGGTKWEHISSLQSLCPMAAQAPTDYYETTNSLHMTYMWSGGIAWIYGERHSGCTMPIFAVALFWLGLDWMCVVAHWSYSNEWLASTAWCLATLLILCTSFGRLALQFSWASFMSCFRFTNTSSFSSAFPITWSTASHGSLNC